MDKLPKRPKMRVCILTTIMLCLLTSGLACEDAEQISLPSDQAVREESPSPGEPTFVFKRPQAGEQVEIRRAITIQGAHRLPTSAHVWPFLKDTYGGYYLQSPAIELLPDGTWEHNSIRAGTEITHIIAVEVDETGHQGVLAWVEAGRFGKIAPEDVKDLEGYRELGRVRIVTPAD